MSGRSSQRYYVPLVTVQAVAAASVLLRSLRRIEAAQMAWRISDSMGRFSFLRFPSLSSSHSTLFSRPSPRAYRSASSPVTLSSSLRTFAPPTLGAPLLSRLLFSPSSFRGPCPLHSSSFMKRLARAASIVTPHRVFDNSRTRESLFRPVWHLKRRLVLLISAMSPADKYRTGSITI